MTVDRAYVERSLNGAVRLGFHDATGLSALELTAEGFFRSFYAILLSAPIYAMTVMGQVRIMEGLDGGVGGKTVSFFEFFLIHLANFTVGSVLFLIAMIPLARVLGLKDRYTTFAVAYNWGTLAIQAIYLPVIVLFGLGVIGAADAVSLNLIVLGFTLYFRFACFRTVFDAPWTMAFALAMIDLLIQWVWILGLTSIA